MSERTILHAKNLPNGGPDPLGQSICVDAASSAQFTPGDRDTHFADLWQPECSESHVSLALPNSQMARRLHPGKRGENAKKKEKASAEC